MKSNTNDTTIHFNDQQENNPLTSNFESEFSPTTIFPLNSLSIYNKLFDFHKKRSRKHMMYVCILYGVMALIGLILFIISFLVPKCEHDTRDCLHLHVMFAAVGLSVFTVGIILALRGLYIYGCRTKQQYDDVDFREYGQQPIIWGYDGEEWIRYLNYIHGPNRRGSLINPLSCFCCRRSDYERLANRRYGHVILHENRLIIDELHFVSFRQYILQAVQLLYIDRNPQIIGLRIHTRFLDGKYSRDCTIDIFAPSSVSLEQLKTMEQLYNRKISPHSRLNLAEDEVHLAGSTLDAL